VARTTDPDGPTGRRRAGVLLHPTSLPSGTLGSDAHRFVDWLAESGFRVWQMLPIGPPGPDRSPYQADSAHAGNPGLISREPLIESGWLHAEDDAAGWLERAVAGCLASGNAEDRIEFEAFKASKAHWLEDYARYRVIKSQQEGRPWWSWPEPLRRRDVDAMERLINESADGLEQVRVTQWFFERQWQALRVHARERGVKLFGDMPIFVAHDSAEVWQRPDLFTVDADGHPTEVAGVPPDYFSEAGQRWGNPLYRWDRMQEDGFGWWIERLHSELARFDWLRIDHFRGFAACWSIPADAATAVDGRWVETPGRALFAKLEEALGSLPLVAEDLGLITPDVVALREALGLPGMRILQFAFDGGSENPYLPFNHARGSVVYTGTHDNDTTLGWWQSLEASQKALVLEVLGHPSEAMPMPLIRTALQSVAALAMIPLQDLLGLDGAHRMNVPATTEGNWSWRALREQLDGLSSAFWSERLKVSGRLQAP
jgi:4-alpha-glucanotransferase